MAIMDLTPGAPPTPTTPVNKFRTQQQLKTSNLFESELSVSKIKYQLDGMKWTVDFFNQILNTNSQAMAPDVNIPSTTLSYNRINKLDIYVASGLPDSNVLDVVGSGHINAGFVPHLGDAFTATVAGGRIAIFVLTAVTKEYYNTHDIYAVDYKLTYFLDTSGAVYNDLVYKTVRTYIYDRYAINDNRVPVVLAADYVARLELNKQPKLMLDHYLDVFYSSDQNLLVLPTHTSIYVDQLTQDAVFKITSVRDDYRLAKIHRGTTGIKDPTIWDAILQQDPEILATCLTDINYHRRFTSAAAPTLSGSYLGVSYTMSDRPLSTVYVPDVIPNPLAARKNVPVPITMPVDAYIFNSAIYNNNTLGALTPFETILLEYINGSTPNLTYLNQLLTEYKHWDYVHQYHLIPMLIVLVNYVVKTTYTPV